MAFKYRTHRRRIKPCANEPARDPRFLACQTAAQAQMIHHQHASEAACEAVELRCASKVTPAFASTERWARLDGGRPDIGGEFEGSGAQLFAPVQVSKKSSTSIGPGARPRSSSRKRRHRAGFSIFRTRRSKAVLATRSSDGGQSFAELRPITGAMRASACALGLDADGSVFAAWIDKRNRVPAHRRAGSTRAQAVLQSSKTAAPFMRAGWQATHLRMLPDGPRVAWSRRPWWCSEHLRRRCAGSCGHDFRRSGDTGEFAASATTIGRSLRARIMAPQLSISPRVPIT